MQVNGKTALVTGGASGLGAATAAALVERGAAVVIGDVQEDRGRETAERLGPSASFLRTDVADEDSVKAAIGQATSGSGRLFIVINCAGILIGEKIVGKHGPHDLNRFRRVIEVNLVGTFNVIRLAAAVMQENPPEESGERGVIINTASVAAFEGQIGQSAYSASKAAIAGLTLPAARELARSGIRVCSIAPGIFDTAMIAGLPDSVKESLGAQVPFPARLGRPEEYAALVQHIIENPMLNGEVIRLDGAIRMTPR
jgi:NAD(P)-dependent dehydrogenase (short-subunit alcohol dehydrogenase family)